MKWFRYLEITGWISLIIFFINMSMTDYSACVLIYKGFIPPLFAMFLPLVWLVLVLIGFGAEIENSIKRHKNPGGVV